MDDEHKTTDPFLGKCKINRLTSFKETKDAYTTKHNSFYSIDYCAIKILMASFCHGFALFLGFFQLRLEWSPGGRSAVTVTEFGFLCP